MTGPVVFEANGATGVGRLRLATGRPGNAITLEAVEGLRAGIREAAASHLRVLVITGADAVFSGGADVHELAAMDEDRFGRYIDEELRLFREVEALGLVTVVAISGPCVGTAAELALCCDLRVGARSAHIQFPEARLGFAAPAARLSRFVGIGPARDLLLSGRAVSAGDALRMGLLDRVCDDDALDPVATEEAAALARVPAAGVRATKANLAAAYAAADVAHEEIVRRAIEAFRSEELRRALAAASARLGGAGG